jgi:hypothetical protein
MNRIKSLAFSGLNVSFSTIDVEGKTVLAVHISDRLWDCHSVARNYDWQHGGDGAATIEAAVASAERYLSRKHGVDSDEYRAECALSVAMAEVD